MSAGMFSEKDQERKRLEHLIDSLGLQEDFILSGSVENPYPYYKSADIYVHATGFEGKVLQYRRRRRLDFQSLHRRVTGNRSKMAWMVFYAD